MANICDNMLTFYTRSVPKYLEENSLVERASVNDYSVQPDIKNDIEHVKEVIVNFDTKWSPPVDIYEKMIKDKSIIAFTARWYEP
jgi:hypothetical protein